MVFSAKSLFGDVLGFIFVVAKGTNRKADRKTLNLISAI
jgi:hypothetical protein